MACSKCGGRGEPRPKTVTALAMRRATQGAFPLASYPDCKGLHAGKYVGESVYVVGRGTPHEKLFKRLRGLPEASAYAMAHRLNLENLPNTTLCDQAILDLYEGAS